ncbi:MAG: DUF1440 domain-containing protein [Myxococcota bacterium]|nr:DUF1440 domain-containing protein [Myxococcota bacterium]
MKETTYGDFIRAAFISSLIGGAVLAFTMVIPAASGVRIWPGTQIAAYPFIGHQVYETGFAMVPMVLGTLIHFAISFLWALGFVFSVRNRTRVQTMLLSVPFGLVVWLVMHQGVLRLINAQDLLSRINPLLGVLQHLGFAVAIGATLVLLQPQNWRFRRTRRALAA